MRFGTTISGANGYDSEPIRRREGRGSQDKFVKNGNEFLFYV
ncbi:MULTISPECIES: hypothetical protein [Dysgonomonas]|nr:MULTISPECIES: hypothetical protein [Dysgonomonas]